MQIALIHGYGSKEHAQSVNLGQDLGGMEMDKVDWMLLTWFSYKHWHIVLMNIYTDYTAFISSLVNMEGLIDGGLALVQHLIKHYENGGTCIINDMNTS